MIKYKNWILIGIIILAFMLRFYHLNSYPALNADEASIGYDAYSLLQTGRDQHGNSWPITFQSFNDYKPGGYVYLVAPFVATLGLNEWAVRMPNAIISVISIYVIYLLVKELFGKEKESLALLSALFLTISPWHIHFSRGGWEANTATFFVMLGVLFFLKGIEKKKYVFLSILFFVMSIYTYQATRVITPLIGFGLVIIYWKSIFKNLRPFVIAGVFGFILLIPLFIDITHGNVLSRAAGVGLFADPGPRSRVEEQRVEHGNIDNIVAKALHNKVVNYTLAFLENWGKHYHGEFLFLSGDSVTRNKIPETGQMYIFDIVFLVVGGVRLLKNKTKKETQILLMWVVVGPIASALTFQAPSALRAETMVVPLVIIASYGCVELLRFISKACGPLAVKKIRHILYIVFGILIIWQFTRYLQMYYVHMAKEYPYSSQYGVKELVDYVKANQDKYKKILVTDRYDQPYVLFLFYMKYPPIKFQAEHTLTSRDQFGLSTVNHFDKYYFASIKFDQAKPENPNTMIIGTNEEIPKEANIVKNIYGTNGFLYFKIVAN
jgi:4-amino-4-deoxy-L-arabinose transferase-like glycosyltransferase